MQHQADQAGDQHIGPLGARKRQVHRQENDQGQGDLQGFDPAGGTETPLQRLDPMEGLGFVEEVAKEHHQQEHAAEGQDAGLRQIQQLPVADRVMQGRIEGLAHAYPSGQGHHQQRAGEAHAEHRNHQTPGEEEPLLARRELIEHAGVHHGVVEGERDLQQQQHQRDPGGRQALHTEHDHQAGGTAGQRNGEVAQVAHARRRGSRAHDGRSPRQPPWPDLAGEPRLRVRKRRRLSRLSRAQNGTSEAPN